MKMSAKIRGIKKIAPKTVKFKKMTRIISVRFSKNNVKPF